MDGTSVLALDQQPLKHQISDGPSNDPVGFVTTFISSGEAICLDTWARGSGMNLRGGSNYQQQLIASSKLMV